MALPATESFTGADNTPMPTHNAAWVEAKNSVLIKGNAAAGDREDDCYVYWTGDAFSADQYSKGAVQNLSASTIYVTMIARGSGTGGAFTAYACYTDGGSGTGHTEIAKIVGGVGTVLKPVAVTFAGGDSLEIRCTGTSTTTIALYKNGALVDSVNDSSSPITSGSAGFGVYNVAAALDNWEGGNLGGATITGTGALVASASSVSGASAAQNATGTGALASVAAAVTGTGSRGTSDLGSSIDVAAGPATLAGTGTVYTPVAITGTGALAAVASTVVGTGSAGSGPLAITGTGALAVQAAVVASTGVRGVAGTGALASLAAILRGRDNLSVAALSAVLTRAITRTLSKQMTG